MFYFYLTPLTFNYVLPVPDAVLDASQGDPAV